MPFRFLALPGEIRNNVYENLTRSISHKSVDVYAAYLRYDRNVEPSLHPRVTLLCRNIDTSILATCKQIHHEPKDIVRRLVTDFILSSPIRIVARAQSVINSDIRQLIELILKKTYEADDGPHVEPAFECCYKHYSHPINYFEVPNEEYVAGRKVGKVRPPLWVWVSQAAAQICLSKQVHLVIISKPREEIEALDHLDDLQDEIEVFRRIVPSLRIQLLGFVKEESISPDSLPKPHTGRGGELWQRMDSPAFTAEDWVHDWFE